MLWSNENYCFSPEQELSESGLVVAHKGVFSRLKEENRVE